MASAGRVIAAVFKREFSSYFRNPTGYVFITLFIFLSAIAAFWQQDFFLNNLANLDQLNRYFPYLLIFLVPAITMGLWADERKLGTDELLLTLPASDIAIVMAKYLAALGIYSVALSFSLSHVAVLHFLGSPDQGMVVATYLGYWLMGAALLSLGLFASQLTENLTVAFVVGAIFCAVPVFLQHAGAILSGSARRLAEQLSVPTQFHDLAHGIVSGAAVVYFLSTAAGVLYLCVKLAGRSRWPSGRGAPAMPAHLLLRALAVVVMIASVTVLAQRLGGRWDVTSEQIHSLAPETRELIAHIPPDKPVFIHAYLSPDVPRSYLEVRRNLVAFLREFGAVSHGSIHTRIIETVKFSPEAREARELYRIEPIRVSAMEEGTGSQNDVFMGLVFTSGAEEFVIPHFDRGLPVEYELMRSVRVVSHARRRKVGILDTKAKLFGEFDFQAKRQFRDWSIISELRKQYDVVRVPADQEYPEDLDVLLAVLPNTLVRRDFARLTDYVKSGHATLVVLDPLPSFNLELAPAASDAPAAPGQPPPPPRVNLNPLLEALGVGWRNDLVVWDTYNPHPQFRELPDEVLFIGAGSNSPMPFQEAEEITAGLQEVVMLYAGALQPRPDAGDVEFIPLMTTSLDSGTVAWPDLVRRSFFGTTIAQGLKHDPDEESYTVAARLRGTGERALNAVVVMDADMMGEQFFELRRRGIENLSFDNVSFLLNAVDELAGDPAFIALRKRRPKHRTLEAVEARTRVYEENRRQQTDEAQADAERKLAEAQARLDSAVQELRLRGDLDDQTREIMISNLQSSEERRLQVARANIEDERDRQIENARISMETSVRGIQNTIKLLAVGLPPIPVLVILIIVSFRRLRIERMRITTDRLVERKTA